MVVLFSTNSWLNVNPTFWAVTQPLGQKQPNRWVCPKVTQHWAVFNPAFFKNAEHLPSSENISCYLGYHILSFKADDEQFWLCLTDVWLEAVL